MALLAKFRPAHKEKPAKKKLPEIRKTSIEFDKFAKRCKSDWLLQATPEDLVLKPYEGNYKEGGRLVEDYFNKDLPHLCYIMPTLYFSYAQANYVKNRNPNRTRGFWYLYAYSKLCMYELAEKGYPLKEKGLVRHEMEWFADSIIASAMLYAYAAGTQDIIPRLYRFAKGVHKCEPYTDAKDYMELFAGENNEALYHRIEQWEKGDMRTMMLSVLKGDAKEFRKALLQSIRHTRKAYDMTGTLIGPWEYACVKIAKNYGIEVEPIEVVELLDWDFDETPIDRNKWKLPLQDEIDEWLCML